MTDCEIQSKMTLGQQMKRQPEKGCTVLSGHDTRRAHKYHKYKVIPYKYQKDRHYENMIRYKTTKYNACSKTNQIKYAVSFKTKELNITYELMTVLYPKVSYVALV